MPSDRPPEDFVSYVTESDKSRTDRTLRGIISLVQTKADWRKRTEVIVKAHFLLPPATAKYILNLRFDNCQHDVASFFRKPTYHVRFVDYCYVEGLVDRGELTLYGHHPELDQQVLPTACLKRIHYSGESVTIVNGESLNREHRSHRSPAHSFRRPMRMRLLCDCRKPRWLRIARNVVCLPIHTQDIMNRDKNSPLKFEASVDYYKGYGDQFYVHCFYSVQLV